jgi:hypothetical protein
MRFLQSAAIGGSLAALFVIATFVVADLRAYFQARRSWREATK